MVTYICRYSSVRTFNPDMTELGIKSPLKSPLAIKITKFSLYRYTCVLCFPTKQYNRIVSTLYSFQH